MTNEEKANEIAKEQSGTVDNYKHLMQAAFDGAMKMAEWKEQQMIEKACQWLKENAYYAYISSCDELIHETDELVNDFKKAMEE